MIDVQPLPRVAWNTFLTEVEKQERRDKKQSLRQKWCKAWLKENSGATHDDKAFLAEIESEGLRPALTAASSRKWRVSRLMKQAKRVEALYDTGYLP